MRQRCSHFTQQLVASQVSSVGDKWVSQSLCFLSQTSSLNAAKIPRFPGKSL